MLSLLEHKIGFALGFPRYQPAGVDAVVHPLPNLPDELDLNSYKTHLLQSLVWTHLATVFTIFVVVVDMALHRDLSLYSRVRTNRT